MKYPNLFSLIKAIPRWTILQIDIILCVGSLLLSYLLRLNFEWEYLYWPEFLTALAAVICVKTVFFLVTKSFPASSNTPAWRTPSGYSWRLR
jgi:hypothetical protein